MEITRSPIFSAIKTFRSINRGANFHFIDEKIFYRANTLQWIHRTHKIVASLRSWRISLPFGHYIIQQVNCHASSNIHYEPVNASLLHRVNFAQTFSNLPKQSPSFSHRCGIRIELFTEKQLLARMFVVCINVYYKIDKFL